MTGKGTTLRRFLIGENLIRVIATDLSTSTVDNCPSSLRQDMVTVETF